MSSRRNPVAVVTGGTAGIGLEACKQLAAKGIDVILTSRTESKGKAAVEDIQKSVIVTNKKVKVEFVQAELGNLKSVATACDSLKGRNIDYLLLNAGVMSAGKGDAETSEDGIESIVAVNHVAGCLMANKLTPILQETQKTSPLESVTPMITFVSSDLHNVHSPTGAAKKVGPVLADSMVRFLAQQGPRGLDATLAMKLPKSDANHLEYEGTWSYKYSKMLNIMSAQAIHNQKKINCNSMEPGFVPASELSRSLKAVLGTWGTRILMWNMYHGPLNWLLRFVVLKQPVRTLEQAARSEVYALTEGKSGNYYRLDEVDEPTPLARDSGVVESFWSSTMAILKEKGFVA